jgi:hypothetical protein
MNRSDAGTKGQYRHDNARRRFTRRDAGSSSEAEAEAELMLASLAVI